MQVMQNFCNQKFNKICHISIEHFRQEVEDVIEKDCS